MALFGKKQETAAAEFSVLPNHLGIIMDGNGRWAKKRGLPRTAGHKAGAEVFKKIAKECGRLGIKEVTFYAFFNGKLEKAAGGSKRHHAPFL